MGDVLVMTTISMYQSLVLLRFSTLDVLENIDIAFICGNKEVTVIDENENI